MRKRIVKKRFSKLVVGISVSCFILFFFELKAQQAGKNKEENKDAKVPSMDKNPQGKISQSKDARDMAKDFLRDEIPLHKGYNQTQQGDVFVAIGSADITVLPKNGPEKYLISRSMAYNKARLTAMNSVAQYIGQEISSRLQSESKESNTKKSSVDKAVARAKEKKKQISKKKETPNIKAQKIDEQAAQVVAQGMVNGLQDYKVFEGGGEIAIIGIVSPKSLEATSAIRNSLTKGTDLPKFEPEKIKLPTSKTGWLTQFGARVVIDKNGNLGILAFGQSPVSSFEDMAREKAEIAAKSNLRQFIGASVMSQRNLNRAQKTKVLEEQPDKKYSTIVENYRSKTESIAKKLNISGIYNRGSEIVEHPLTNTKVAISAVYWSAKSAKQANKLKEKMKDVNKSKSSTSSGGMKKFKQGADIDKKKSIEGESGSGTW